MKQELMTDIAGMAASHPPRGAWVETPGRTSPQRRPLVAPPAGCVG